MATDKEYTSNKIRGIIIGNSLRSKFIKENKTWFALIVILAILYIYNGYICDIERKKIGDMRKELTDIYYDAMERHSELLEKSRQSHIDEYINSHGDRMEITSSSPFIIK